MKLFSPAKINLFLAVTGRRPDGYHSLLSLVAPLAFGDDLEIVECSEESDQLRCDQPGIPLDGSNLILKAANSFRRKSGLDRHFEFTLTKRIPSGGGFGGGSSNAVCALRGMNQLCGNPLSADDLFEVAEELGSDCPLFLVDGPVVMRGRGEKLQPVPELADFLQERRVHLFNPGFFSSTVDLFRKMAERGKYTASDFAEKQLEDLMRSIQKGDFGWTMRNDLGKLLATKYLFYDTLFALFRKIGLSECAVTGSGSGAFVLSRRESDRKKMADLCDQFLDGEGFMIETRFLGNKDRLVTQP